MATFLIWLTWKSYAVHLIVSCRDNIPNLNIINILYSRVFQRELRWEHSQFKFRTKSYAVHLMRVFSLTVLICVSLWIDCLFEISQNRSVSSAFIAGWLQGHWWGFISRNYVVWPTFLLMNVFVALKGSHFWFLFPKLISFSAFDSHPWQRSQFD